ncbi:GNAT family N-acetyltransferase [Streptomyces sp. NPDC020096]
MSRAIEVRYIEESDYGDWMLATRKGFLRPPVSMDQDTSEVPSVREIEPARTQGAFDNGRCVATFRTLPRELTVPGGGTVPADAVSGVTVTATHRRRGLLTRMMARGLAAAKERGDAVSILIAAEYPIYGRFGYGPATWVTDWRVEIPRARLGRHDLPDGARIDLADGAEVRKAGPELYERVRRLTPGAINRTENFWKLYTGEVELPSHPWTEPFHAVYRDASGRVDGLLTYAVDDVWDAKMPQDTLTVRSMIAATPEAERALWGYALSVDWVVKLDSGSRPPDDLLPLLLGDPRAARVTSHADFMWLRVLDVVAALEARGYASTGELVLRIRDADGYADGRWRLTASPEGAEVRATNAEPDLALDVRELGALYLGDESAVRLAALGRVEERRPGAAARADALLRTPRRPWCPEVF